MHINDYTKKNLEDLLVVVEGEINRVKIVANQSGYIKYSAFGHIVRKYRKVLKSLATSIHEDLKEDFNEDGSCKLKVEFEKVSKREPSQFIKNIDAAQKILNKKGIK